MLWDMFSTFFVIGLISFGGGYPMIPVMQEEFVNKHHWMTMQAFTDMVGVAGMSPGPIAANCAIFIGYHQMGIMGAFVSALAIVLPSLLLIVAISAIFYKIQQSFFVKSAFYGLRSVITGLIVYAALLFAANSGFVSGLSWRSVSLVVICVLSFVALMRYRVHPIYVILMSGLVGAAIYG